MMLKHNPAIIAIATAAGRGGVGIVRLSGGQNVLHCLALHLTQKHLIARYATYTAFLSESQQPIDHGLALWFPAPHSYTGEDILELQAHGGPVVLNMLIKRCLVLASILKFELRIAQPGEFTQRAFLNGQLDLAQAESVADLIEASTEIAAQAASRALSGVFSLAVKDLVYQLTQLRMLVEATLDFPEEEIEFLKKADAIGQLNRIQTQLRHVCQTTQQGALLREGVRVVLVGLPNVGKSSLLNALAGQDIAIVTPIAGTTRDTITQSIQLDGVPLEIIDTAGLRDTTDEVERLGIERTWKQIETAHVIVQLHDVALMNEININDIDLNNHLIAFDLPKHLPIIHVLNKIDLLNNININNINNIDNHKHIKTQTVAISAKTGYGLDTLKQTLLTLAGWQTQVGGEGIYIARERHVQALNESALHLEAAQEAALMGDLALDLFAESLRLAQIALGQITGEFTSDDLLGVIFGQFCIGK